MSIPNMHGKDFPTVSHRVIYSCIALFDDFHPTKSAEISESAQRQLYDFLKGIMESLYEDISILSLPADPDESEDRPAAGKSYLDTRKIMRSATKKIIDFLTLLHNIGKIGTHEAGSLIVPTKEAKLNKGKCELLGKFGLVCDFGKESVSISSDTYPNLAEAWPYLAQKTDSLFLFSHAVFADETEYGFCLMKKLLGENHPNLVKYVDYFMTNGYRFSWNTGSTFEITDFVFRKNVSGLIMHFDRRFYQQIDFHIVNHINYKAMLEDFEKQSDKLKAFMVEASRKCSQCLKCTKGNPNTALFYHDVVYNGDNYRLCPSFPKFDWTEISDERMEKIIECIEMQEKYSK